MQTLNHDDEYEPTDADKALLAELMAPFDEPVETKPPGYGKLAVTYEWRSYVMPGARDTVRAWCIPDERWMTSTIKVDPRYGKHTNRHADKIDYNGKPVLCWECRTCGQWVVQ